MEHKERCKKYYEEHKEQLKAYAREHYNSEYHKNYYAENKDRIKENIKRWKENNKGSYVYFMMDSLENYIYIGSTNDLNTRLSCHLTGNSNLKSTYNQLVAEYDLNKIMYKDFSEKNISRLELFYLEYLCKQQYKDKIGKNNINIDFSVLDNDRKEELKVLLNETEFKIFEDTKYKKAS